MKKIKVIFLLSIAFTIGFAVLIGLRTVRQSSVQIPSSNPTPTVTQLPTVVQKPQFIVKGSIPYWDQESALSSFTQNVDSFDYINLFWYYLSPDGSIVKYSYAKEDKSIIDFAHDNNVKVFAVVTNLPEYDGSSWDSERVENVIAHDDTKNAHIGKMVSKLNQLEFDGVIIDYEDVNPFLKDDFSSFIKSLSEVLHRSNKLLAVALHPKNTVSDRGNGAFQDWEALAQHADQLNIMAYGEHWDESNAGPIASLGWVEKIINYTKTLNIPSEKFILGIPLYGYDWNKDHEEAVEGLTYKDIQNLLAEFDKKEEWDSQFLSPYFLYDKNGDNHEVWFENARSVGAKIELAQKAGFAGVTFWRLGGEDQTIWPLVNPTE